MVDIIENTELNIEEVMGKVDKLQEKIKFTAFGKTKARSIKKKVESAAIFNVDKDLSDNDEAREILQKQSSKVEDAINKIKGGTGGRCGQVFQMRELIAGPKKAAQEAHAIKDPVTKELVVSGEGIKKVSLNHCLNVLQKNVPEEGYKNGIEIMSHVHDLRMAQTDLEEFNIKEEVFKNILKKYEKKNKKSYDFLTKSGQEFKDAIFKLCKRMISEEEFPKRFEETTLFQLYKGKGKKDDLENSRYIHLKDWLPRTCDSVLVDLMKEKILASSSIFQIGGQEGHRTQEHLFTLRSIIVRESYLGGGAI